MHLPLAAENPSRHTDEYLDALASDGNVSAHDSLSNPSIRSSKVDEPSFSASFRRQGSDGESRTRYYPSKDTLTCSRTMTKQRLAVYFVTKTSHRTLRARQVIKLAIRGIEALHLLFRRRGVGIAEKWHEERYD